MTKKQTEAFVIKFLLVKDELKQHDVQSITTAFIDKFKGFELEVKDQVWLQPKGRFIAFYFTSQPSKDTVKSMLNWLKRNKQVKNLDLDIDWF